MVIGPARAAAATATPRVHGMSAAGSAVLACGIVPRKRPAIQAGRLAAHAPFMPGGVRGSQRQAAGRYAPETWIVPLPSPVGGSGELKEKGPHRMRRGGHAAEGPARP